MESMKTDVVKRKPGRPRKAATQPLGGNPVMAFVVNKDSARFEKPYEQSEEVEEVIAEPLEETQEEEVMTTEVMKVDDAPIARRSPRRAGRLTMEDRADADYQMTEMRTIAGMILLNLRKALHNKQLDFQQQIQLLKQIQPYLNYENVGNKSAADVGMDTFAMKYLEINARVSTVQGKSVSKVLDK